MVQLTPFNMLQQQQLQKGHGGHKPHGANPAASQAAQSAAGPQATQSPFAITPTSATQGPANQGIPKGGHSGGDQLAQFKSQIASGQIKPNLNAPGLGPNSRMSWTA